MVVYLTGVDFITTQKSTLMNGIIVCAVRKDRIVGITYLQNCMQNRICPVYSQYKRFFALALQQDENVV